MALRILGWCERFDLRVNGQPIHDVMLENGYCVLKRAWGKEDNIALRLEMLPVRTLANPRVRENAGKTALQRGPIIYCMEEADNGALLPDLALDTDYSPVIEWVSDVPGFGEYPALTGRAFRSDEAVLGENRLYFPLSSRRRTTGFRAVPYCLLGERAVGEMLVWTRRISHE